MIAPLTDAAMQPDASLSTYALSALGLDDFEQGLLPVLRQFLLSHDQPQGQAWQQAYLIAVERWGEALGLPAALAAMKLVQAVLECRGEGFCFVDPFDLDHRAEVSRDEAALLRMLHHMRRDETPLAREAVADVTLGQMDPHVIRAGLSLANRFSKGQSPARATPPRLRVVG